MRASNTAAGIGNLLPGVVTGKCSSRQRGACLKSGFLYPVCYTGLTRCSVNAAGFLLALVLDRCIFVDFSIFNDYFQHKLNFSWKDQRQQLIDQGHDPDSANNKPLQLPQSGTSSAAGSNCSHDGLAAANISVQIYWACYTSGSHCGMPKHHIGSWCHERILRALPQRDLCATLWLYIPHLISMLSLRLPEDGVKPLTAV